MVKWVTVLQALACSSYRRADNSGPVFFTVSAWEWVYAMKERRERNKRGGKRERETSKRHVGEAHSALITAILLPQRLSCACSSILGCATDRHRPTSAVRPIRLENTKSGKPRPVSETRQWELPWRFGQQYRGLSSVAESLQGSMWTGNVIGWIPWFRR
jgi:hypothetical protein